MRPPTAHRLPSQFLPSPAAEDSLCRRLRSLADGRSRPGPEHFEVTELATPALGDGILVELLTLSADPYMRGGLKMPLEGDKPRTMSGYVSGRVLESAVDGWAAGDLFGASLPYVDVQAISADQLKRLQIWKLTGLIGEADISHGIGAMGMPGATAYGGLIDVLRPNHGDTIWVSGAGGAVGSMVGQIAKNVYGCTVIGRYVRASLTRRRVLH